MPECNCTIPYYYEYFEYKIKSQKFTKLNDDDFAIKIVFDLLDKDYNIVKDNELVYSSVFEKIGIDTYNVITQITQHKSLPNQMVGAKQAVVEWREREAVTSTQYSKQKVTSNDISDAENNPMSVVSNNKSTSSLSKTRSCVDPNSYCVYTSDSNPKADEKMTTKKRNPSAGTTAKTQSPDFAICNMMRTY